MFYFAFPPTFIIINLLLPLHALDVIIVIILINLCVTTSEIFSWGQAFLAQGTDHFLNKMLSIRKVRMLITSRYIAMQSYECVIISKMFLIYFISYGCNGGALVFLGGAEASASPSFALPMFITIKQIIILHLFLGVPAATVGGTGTPWHTRGYAPDWCLNVSIYFVISLSLSLSLSVHAGMRVVLGET